MLVSIPPNGLGRRRPGWRTERHDRITALKLPNPMPNAIYPLCPDVQGRGPRTLRSWGTQVRLLRPMPGSRRQSGVSQTFRSPMAARLDVMSGFAVSRTARNTALEACHRGADLGMLARSRSLDA